MPGRRPPVVHPNPVRPSGRARGSARWDARRGRRVAPTTGMMGYAYRPALSEGALKCPIFQTSTFVFGSAEEGKSHFELAYGLRPPRRGEQPGLIYSRVNNPDLEILEERLTLWDDAEAGAVFASGMAAIATTLLEFAQPGDVVLSSTPLYGGSDHLLTKVFSRFGIGRVTFRAGAGPEAIGRAVRAAKAHGKVAAVLVETPANPTNDLVDVAACAAVARAAAPKGRFAPVVVDNTFLGPLFQKPLHHGADLVVYSATKFLGGHSDLIAGAVLGPRELVARVKVLRTFLGSMLDPWGGWLLLRSLETLKLRMEAQQENARHVADFLAAHPAVERVHYLGHLREGDPGHDLFVRQCTGPGSMISFDVRGGEEAAFRVLNAFEVIHLAVSLGGTESLASHPASTTHADIPPAARLAAGIGPGLVRLSVGVEDPHDLIADLGRALARAVSSPRKPAPSPRKPRAAARLPARSVARSRVPPRRRRTHAGRA